MAATNQNAQFKIETLPAAPTTIDPFIFPSDSYIHSDIHPQSPVPSLSIPLFTLLSQYLQPLFKGFYTQNAQYHPNIFLNKVDTPYSYPVPSFPMELHWLRRERECTQCLCTYYKRKMASYFHGTFVFESKTNGKDPQKYIIFNHFSTSKITKF